MARYYRYLNLATTNVKYVLLHPLDASLAFWVPLLCKNIVKRGGVNKRELLIYFTFPPGNAVSFLNVSNTSLLDLFRSLS
jgi:hypothetical protein